MEASVSTSSGSDALYGNPWRDRTVTWQTRPDSHPDEDVITNLEQLIRAFFLRREGRITGLFIAGLLLAIIGFFWIGSMLQVFSFILFTRGERKIFRILKKVKLLHPFFESPFMKQALQLFREERTKHSLKEDIENYEPLQDLFRGEAHFPRVNILLMGPIGVGKSSFYNTINSIFRGKIFNIARSGSSDHSLTTKFRCYPVISNSGNREMKFCLCDTMGLEQNHLMDKSNMTYLLGGNIQDKFMLDPSSSISPDTPGFKRRPILEDQIHCVALVIDASTVDAVDAIKDVIQNIKEMQTVMNSLDIPQVMILTNVDKVCKQTKNDVSNALKSKIVAQTVGKVSEMFGLPQNSIYPVKNYEKECELDPNIDTLALLALQGILNHADAFLFMHKEEILQNYS